MRHLLICIAGSLLLAPQPTYAQSVDNGVSPSPDWGGRGGLAIFGAVNENQARGLYGISGGPLLEWERVRIPVRLSLMLSRKQNAICQATLGQTEIGACTDLLAWVSSSALVDVVNRGKFKLYLGGGGDAGWLMDFHGVAGVQYKRFIGEFRVGLRQVGLVLGLTTH